MNCTGINLFSHIHMPDLHLHGEVVAYVDGKKKKSGSITLKTKELQNSPCCPNCVNVPAFKRLKSCIYVCR